MNLLQTNGKQKQMRFVRLAGILTIIALLAVPGFALPTFAAADDNHITITGDAQSFSISGGGRVLFEHEKLLPGERTKPSSITITNSQTLPFTLSVRVDDLGSDTGLLDFLEIQVRLDGNLIGSFPAKGQTSGGYQNAYPFGTIQPGVTVRLDVSLALPRGAQMKDELQETTAAFDWIFIAASDQPSAPGGDQSPGGGTPTPGGAVVTTAVAGGQPGGGVSLPGGDASVPGSSLPNLENISDQETPLKEGGSKAPDISAWSIVNLILTIAAILLGIWGLIRVLWGSGREEKTGSERKDSGGDADAAGSYAGQEPDASKDASVKRGYALALTLGALGAAGTIILFLLTEDTRLPITLLNSYTIIYAAVVAAELLAILLSGKRSGGEGTRTAAGVL